MEADFLIWWKRGVEKGRSMKDESGFAAVARPGGIKKQDSTGQGGE
jgi:hypothetical protein